MSLVKTEKVTKILYDFNTKWDHVFSSPILIPDRLPRIRITFIRIRVCRRHSRETRAPSAYHFGLHSKMICSKTLILIIHVCGHIMAKIDHYLNIYPYPRCLRACVWTLGIRMKFTVAGQTYYLISTCDRVRNLQKNRIFRKL